MNARTAPQATYTMRDRMGMYNGNALKMGLFGANCSSGRCVTNVPERWTGNWEDNLALAQMCDERGIEFMLPVGRWKGYGGDTDYMGTTLETITWATGLLAKTKRLIAFGTVHAPLFHPLIAAKQFVTADQISGILALRQPPRMFAGRTAIRQHIYRRPTQFGVAKSIGMH